MKIYVKATTFSEDWYIAVPSHVEDPIAMYWYVLGTDVVGELALHCYGLEKAEQLIAERNPKVNYDIYKISISPSVQYSNMISGSLGQSWTTPNSVKTILTEGFGIDVDYQTLREELPMPIQAKDCIRYIVEKVGNPDIVVRYSDSAESNGQGIIVLNPSDIISCTKVKTLTGTPKKKPHFTNKQYRAEILSQLNKWIDDGYYGFIDDDIFVVCVDDGDILAGTISETVNNCRAKSNQYDDLYDIVWYSFPRISSDFGRYDPDDKNTVEYLFESARETLPKGFWD